jgi:hypothetical protein
MIDMNKEIIFKDGWTLDGGPVTDHIAACAFDAINLGYKYGLTLDRFYFDSEMIHFEWRGSKKNVLAWFTYTSTNLTSESEEERNATLEIIRNK